MLILQEAGQRTWHGEQERTKSVQAMLREKGRPVLSGKEEEMWPCPMDIRDRDQKLAFTTAMLEGLGKLPAAELCKEAGASCSLHRRPPVNEDTAEELFFISHMGEKFEITSLSHIVITLYSIQCSILEAGGWLQLFIVVIWHCML
jgi:hypothetical protein